MESELKKLIEETLNIPCELDAGPMMFPGATIEVYLRNPEAFGDGQPDEIVNYVTINLYYKGRADRDSAADKLVPVLVSSGYLYPTDERYYDTEAKKHRAVLNTSKIGGKQNAEN